MPRDIPLAVQTQISSTNVIPIGFAKLQFDTFTLYVCTADRTITFDGNDYLGVGNFGGVSSTIEETSELSANGMALVLSGVDPTQLAIALGENYQGRPATIYLGFLDDTSYQLVADPIIIFKGRMDTMEIKTGEMATITLRIENRLADWDRPKVLRYNNQTQQTLYQGDKGLEFVEQATEKEIFWGRPDALAT
jgi:hypothetical protein